MKNIVYIATSLDGYIADRNGGLGFLEMVPNPDMDDFGWIDFMASVDGLLMGRVTYETVLGFDCPWPYSVPVFVLSSTLTDVPEALKGKVEIVSGELKDVLADLDKRGLKRLYVDGGKLIQGCLELDAVDEMIVTTIPMLLGGGSPLFASFPDHLEFEHVDTTVLLGQLVKSHYRRKR